MAIDIKTTPLTLAVLEIGHTGLVSRIHGRGRISRRLMEMGLVPGVRVRAIKTAPFGDPIEFRIKGYNLALRKSEAESVEIVNEPAE